MPAQQQPNILFIMTDQQRFDAMSCHGGQAITPHLDRLAGMGADLQQFYTQTPVCVPSRQNIFSGRHFIARNGEAGLLQPSEIHLFKTLKQAGYYLGYTGKNHLLETQEFDNFDFSDLDQPLRKEPQQSEARQAFQRLQQQSGEMLETKGCWASGCFFEGDETAMDSYRIRESAIRCLRQAPADRPFCLTVSFLDPHVPHVAPAKFKEWYPLEHITLPSYPPEVLEQKAPRFKLKQRGQRMDLATTEGLQRYLQVYYSMISCVDEQVGAIWDELKASGRDRDTIIVFTADHGDFACDYGMTKKDLVLLDVLLNVPCLIVWPGHIAPNAISNTLAEQIDLMPTLLDLCDIAVPPGCQGQSLKPLLFGETAVHKNTVHLEVCRPASHNPYATFAEFYTAWQRHHAHPGHELSWSNSFNIPGDYSRGIRTTEWKYIWYGDEFEELYDLRIDPHEFDNLALRPEYRPRCAEMNAQMWQAAQDLSDWRSSAERVTENAIYDMWK